MTLCASIRPLTLAALLASALAAQAQTSKPYWIHVGPVSVDFKASATVSVPALGGTVPGQSATAKDNVSLAVDVGMEVAPNTIVSLTVGLPPTTELTGKGGPFDGAKLGKVQYGPAVLSAHYHFDAGSVKPYLGGGLTYVIALDSKDATLTRLKVKSALGGALQAGVDIPINKDWSAFLDVKKLFVKAKASFSGPAPGTAEVKLDPVLVHLGVGWRF